MQDSCFASMQSLHKYIHIPKIDVHDEIKNTVVLAMDGEYAGNAAIPCYRISFQHGCCYFANAGCIA